MAILGYYTFFVLYSNHRDKSIKTTSGIVETGGKPGTDPDFLTKSPPRTGGLFLYPFSNGSPPPPTLENHGHPTTVQPGFRQTSPLA